MPNSSTLYVPGQPVAPNPVNSVVTVSNSGLSSFYQSFPYDVTPTSDNAPYFWHFARFGTVIGHYAQSLSSTDREDSVGERVLLLLLAISVLAALAFLLVPFVVVRSTWSRMPAKRWSSVFFGGVGLGFIFFEITLMQRLNLFLGFPTYSLTVTLACAAALHRCRRPARRRSLAPAEPSPSCWGPSSGSASSTWSACRP